jgi:hypothetical protein
MTREELDKKIELTQAKNRAAIKRADAFLEEMDRLVAIHNVTTDRLLEDLREDARRGRF